MCGYGVGEVGTRTGEQVDRIVNVTFRNTLMPVSATLILPPSLAPEPATGLGVRPVQFTIPSTLSPAPVPTSPTPQPPKLLQV